MLSTESFLKEKQMKTILSVISATFLTVGLSLNANAAGTSTSSYPSINNQAKAGQFGLGLEVGSLAGVSGQYWMANDRALNLTFAAEHGNAVISGAHLWLFPGAFADGGRDANYFVPYIGAGAIAAFGTQSDYFSRNSENVAVAAQIPLGIEFLPSLQRFDVFAEIAPSLELVPTMVGFLTADLGARFYF
jgi:hypothetical protein